MDELQWGYWCDVESEYAMGNREKRYMHKYKAWVKRWGGNEHEYNVMLDGS